MRVKSSAEPFRANLDQKVERKEEQDSFEQFDREQRKKRQQEEIEVTEEKVAKAIDEFAEDAQAKANGLKAEKQGSGPGLRVVLTDGSGAIVRQLTGEEFLRLRATLNSDEHSSGKILDQRF